MLVKGATGRQILMAWCFNTRVSVAILSPPTGVSRCVCVDRVIQCGLYHNNLYALMSGIEMNNVSTGYAFINRQCHQLRCWHFNMNSSIFKETFGIPFHKTRKTPLYMCFEKLSLNLNNYTGHVWYNYIIIWIPISYFQDSNRFYVLFRPICMTEIILSAVSV